jgi:hypothetical protein
MRRKPLFDEYNLATTISRIDNKLINVVMFINYIYIYIYVYMFVVMYLTSVERDRERQRERLRGGGATDISGRSRMLNIGATT